MKPLVDVVVLNYNGKRFLEACLSSVLKSTYPNFRLYVLDNASTDPDVAYIQTNFPEVSIIQNPKNNGFCAAYNLALSQTDGNYFVCLNNDVTVEPDWLDHMVNLAEANDTIAAIQPKLVNFFDPGKFEYAGASGGMMDRYGFPFLRGRVFDSIEDDYGQYDDAVEVFWTTGAAMFIRKSALHYSGMFDNTIVHHMDEIDLCWRLRLAGFSLFVQPQSVIHHIGGATIQSKSLKKVYWNHRNSLYIMLKNFGTKRMFSSVIVHVFLDYVAIFYALITMRKNMFLGIIKAHCWVVCNIGLIIRKHRAVQSIRKVEDAEIEKWMYPGSIVWQYFGRNIKTYTNLINQII